MEKVIYLLFAPESADGDALRETLVTQAAPALRQAGAMQTTLCVHDGHTRLGAADAPQRSADPRDGLALAPHDRRPWPDRGRAVQARGEAPPATSWSSRGRCCTSRPSESARPA